MGIFLWFLVNEIVNEYLPEALVGVVLILLLKYAYFVSIITNQSSNVLPLNFVACSIDSLNLLLFSSICILEYH